MKKYHIYLMTIIALFCCACQKKKELLDDDFRAQMGQATPLWKHVVTNEDFGYLQLFENNYIANKHLQYRKTESGKIPKIVHFIWLGPKEFPRDSYQNIKSWIEKNPDYTFMMWTDRKRDEIDPKLHTQLMEDYPFSALKDEYYLSNNYAERSDILRYEILYEEGGIYVDHDVVCYRSLDSLVNNYDLVCALEPPHSPKISSSISVCNNIIATIPFHPFIKETIDHVKERWERVGRSFPGTDQESTIYRVAHRTFASFDDAVRENLSHSDLHNMVLPASYFNSIGKKAGSFAHHLYSGTWYKTEDPFENLVRKQLDKMAKKSNKMLLLGAISLLINIGIVGWLIVQKSVRPEAKAK